MAVSLRSRAFCKLTLCKLMPPMHSLGRCEGTCKVSELHKMCNYDYQPQRRPGVAGSLGSRALCKLTLCKVMPPTYFPGWCACTCKVSELHKMCNYNCQPRRRPGVAGSKGSRALRKLTLCKLMPPTCSPGRCKCTCKVSELHKMCNYDCQPWRRPGVAGSLGS